MARPDPLIFRRIRVALHCARWRRLPVRSIYLNDADWELLNQAASKRWGRKVVCLSFEDHPIATVDFDGHRVKPGSKSCVYLKGGEAVAIPKRLSPRVAQPKAKAA